ncbi:MAG: ribosome-associated translation inhibitor RaiA [Abitibacteriaceae bacterium]|nr:ribosome-associated translation inhibitor RaiA [Abditibacteriaceae bacterium]
MAKNNETQTENYTTNINVQARNCEVGPELHEHFKEKLQSLQKLWVKAVEANIRVGQERGRYVAEITLSSGSLMMRGEERADNLRQAFDNAVDKLHSQLVRYKKKAIARKRRHDNRDDAAGTLLKPTLAPNGTVLPEDVIAPPELNGESNGDVAEDEGVDEQAVRVKRFALKPMSPAEAALQMDLLGHSFFVFRDAETNQVSVVYHRRSGGYGLIEPVAD